MPAIDHITRPATVSTEEFTWFFEELDRIIAQPSPPAYAHLTHGSTQGCAPIIVDRGTCNLIGSVIR